MVQMQWRTHVRLLLGAHHHHLGRGARVHVAGDGGLHTGEIWWQPSHTRAWMDQELASRKNSAISRWHVGMTVTNWSTRVAWSLVPIDCAPQRHQRRHACMWPHSHTENKASRSSGLAIVPRARKRSSENVVTRNKKTSDFEFMQISPLSDYLVTSWMAEAR